MIIRCIQKCIENIQLFQVGCRRREHTARNLPFRRWLNMFYIIFSWVVQNMLRQVVCNESL